MSDTNDQEIRLRVTRSGDGAKEVITDLTNVKATSKLAEAATISAHEGRTVRL